jgi:hypothetical protein
MAAKRYVLNGVTYDVALIHRPAGIYPAGSGTRQEPESWRVSVHINGSTASYGRIFGTEAAARAWFDSRG